MAKGADHYDRSGFDENGINQKKGTLWDDEEYDAQGYDKAGVGRDGFDRDGFEFLTGIHSDYQPRVCVVYDFRYQY